MVQALNTEDLRKSSLKHNWMLTHDWVRMAEEGDPLLIVEGKGLEVVDSTGNTYLDVNGGYACVNVGYGRTEIADAALAQMQALSFAPQGATAEPVIRFAERLSGLTPGDLSDVWPVTGGSEANETAVNIAKAYHVRNGQPGRYKVISRKGSFHGALGLTTWLGGRSDRADFEPAYPGMVYAPHPNPYACEFGGQTPSECAVRCAQAVEELITLHDPETVAAVIAEPVSSSGYDAAAVPGPEYWPMLREICDRYGVLLIADEVITGFGRTGRWFAVEHWDTVPDIMAIAKGISSAYWPMAATVVTKQVAGAFDEPGQAFDHSPTSAGHPVSAAVALANIDILENESFIDRSAEAGTYLLQRLREIQADHPIVGDVRGLGLLAAVDLVRDRETKERFPKDFELDERLARKFRQRGLILHPRGAIWLTPPLCVTHDEIDRIVDAIDEAVGEVEAEASLVT